MEQPTSNQFPREILPSTGWRRLSMLIILTLLMVILVNSLAIGYLDRYSINYGYWTIHQKWNLLGSLPSQVDWLILGDSSCSQGIMPVVFMNELDQSAINLCTTGDMATLGDLWMLEEYIKRFGSPRNVLVVHTYDIWHRDFNPVRLGQIPRPFGFWEEHTLGNELMAEKDIRDATFLEHYIPLYSQNKTIGAMIRSTLSANLIPFKSMWEIDPDGFVPAYEPKPDIVLAGEQQHIDFVTHNNFHVSPLNDRAMQELVKWADGLHFSLYLADAPTYEGLFTNSAYSDYYQDMREYLQGIADVSNNVIYINDVKTFPIDVMQNPDHLIVSAADEFTQWLVGEIKEAKGRK